MRKELKIKSILGVLSGCLLSGSALSQTCIDAPDCAAMGYKFTEAQCSGMSAVKCPYNSDLYFCIQGSTDAYDSNIGDILYDDFTTSPSIISTKKPIGVVFTTGRDVNYAVALQDVNGGKMEQLYSYSTNTVPNYTTQGTILGDWEVPTLNLMQTAFYNKTKVNESLNRVGGTVMTGSYKVPEGQLSMVDGSTKTEEGGFLRSVIKINKPAGKSYNYTIASCNGTVDGDIYHAKFEQCRTTAKAGDVLSVSKKLRSYTPDLKSEAAIGVVFDGAARKAVALTNVKQDGSAATSTGDYMYWSSSYCDTPNLENCSSGSELTCGMDGRANTNAILGSTCNGTTYAANAVNAYKPAGVTVAPWFAAGQWFLPSAKELYTVYQNKTAINSALLKLGKPAFYEDRYYWSSTENDYGTAWRVALSSGSRLTNDKTYNSGYVRPVLAF